MKTKRLISFFVLIATVATLGLCLSGCKKEVECVQVELNYSIIDSFTSLEDRHKVGELLNKPSDPTYIDHVFNDGIGGTYGFSDFEFPISNPRMKDGYNPNKNYFFIGWYKQPMSTNPLYLQQWNFAEDRVYKNTTLYAHWVEIA